MKIILFIYSPSTISQGCQCTLSVDHIPSIVEVARRTAFVVKAFAVEASYQATSFTEVEHNPFVTAQVVSTFTIVEASFVIASFKVRRSPSGVIASQAVAQAFPWVTASIANHVRATTWASIRQSILELVVAVASRERVKHHHRWEPRHS